MKIYIASSWKNQHAVEMLTRMLRDRGQEVKSFVEQEGGAGHFAKLSFDQWVDSSDGRECFEYDTSGATDSDLVIYLGPSGIDAWAEVGAAWSRGVNIVGLWAKGEQVGLMRRMIGTWFKNYNDLLLWLAEWGPMFEAGKRPIAAAEPPQDSPAGHDAAMLADEAASAMRNLPLVERNPSGFALADDKIG